MAPLPPKFKKQKLWTSKQADEKFSKWIIERDGRKCANCGRGSHLTNSHYWGRSNSATRYDPDNCDTLCWMPCHVSWEKQKQGDYMQFKLRQLTKIGYDSLEKRGRSIMKREDAIIACMKLLGAI
jgi:hypothetical protein